MSGVVERNETSSMSRSTPILRLGDRVKFRRGLYAAADARVHALDVPLGDRKGVTVKFGSVEMTCHYHEVRPA